MSQNGSWMFVVFSCFALNDVRRYGSFLRQVRPKQEECITWWIRSVSSSFCSQVLDIVIMSFSDSSSLSRRSGAVMLCKNKNKTHEDRTSQRRRSACATGKRWGQKPQNNFVHFEEKPCISLSSKGTERRTIPDFSPLRTPRELFSGDHCRLVTGKLTCLTLFTPPWPLQADMLDPAGGTCWTLQSTRFLQPFCQNNKRTQRWRVKSVLKFPPVVLCSLDWRHQLLKPGLIAPAIFAKWRCILQQVLSLSHQQRAADFTGVSGNFTWLFVRELCSSELSPAKNSGNYVQ